jgi:hypothetical protein
MEGEKIKPLVIGKSRKPRCFKGVKLQDYEVSWFFNKKAWMTREIMSEWLTELNNEMRKEKRNILLFLDNATSHPEAILSNVTLRFLPPNTTAECQPLDQGIIKNFKHFYRELIMKRLLSNIESSSSPESLEKSISILDAITWIIAAWLKVKKSTIENCFAKAGFSVENYNDDSFDAEDDIPLRQLIFPDLLGQPVDLAVYATIDENLDTEDGDINIEHITHETDILSDEDELENELELEELESEIPDYKAGHRELKKLEKFAYRLKDGYALQYISKLKVHFEDKIVSDRNVRQTTVEEFFKHV